MSKKHTEDRYEDSVEESLVSSGYIRGEKDSFNAAKGLFCQDVVDFIRISQPKQWDGLCSVLKDKVEETVIDSLEKELETKGSLTVLRHGFKCFGKTLRLAYFQPNSGMNPDAWELYNKNLVKIYRQVHFSVKNPALSLDCVISVNGLPVVTIELKNHMSGQTVKNAKYQYAIERDPNEKIFQFKKRSLVHFAADTDEVWMTTKLAGKSTYFLPFNKGHNMGAGNPPGPKGEYKTHYLWDDVLQKDSLLDILARFLHLQVEEKRFLTDKGTVKTVKKEVMIFPRYHQLDSVRKLLKSAKDKGSGHNYLIQHSAGSGKSNSIAWLAHRLSNLHDSNDNHVFDSVVVITDRRVLDKQLQDTIYQFEHKTGVVEKIDENTQQLAKALASGVPIIISTIQKFPFITQAMETLNKKGEGVDLDTSGKKFAVIVDEAHSSQSGETAMELKKILNKEGIAAAVAEQILDMEEENLTEEAKKKLAEEMAKRGRQENISFFAFTATPKYKTLAVFDEPGENGLSPFHHYSMKQAIQEGFIHDVLKNYVTYKAYSGLIKAIDEDPEVPKKKAIKALARFLSIHPYNISQKVEVIVEHFRNHTMHKIGGRAKAMVVTGSRKHAVRYKLAFDKYIGEKKYTNIKSLVAFSGTVNDDGKEYTEVAMNKGIKESELPRKFDTDEYKVLLVAEKYQTGFDQPFLHSMYVDKRLSGIQAVQTLSRLNRTASGKEDTFVLDFVNDANDIYDSFKPFYETTQMGEEVHPHQLYDIQHKIMEAQIIFENEINEFCEIWYGCGREENKNQHKQLNSLIDISVERYKELDLFAQEDFKGMLTTYRNLYGFASQIIPFQDSTLEKLYTYLRYFLTKLPKRDEELGINIDDDVALKYYRLQKISEGSIDLEVGNSEPLKGPTEVGTGDTKGEKVKLSTLVDKLNDRFGTDFTQADQLFFDQIREEAVSKDDIRNAAQANKYEDFILIFEKLLEEIIIGRIDGNESIFEKYMGDKEFRTIATQHISQEVYEKARG